MKLRMPHKLQTALLTAFASVTFTTVGTATLTAAEGDASTAESVTDTGFVVSEEALEVDLGEEEEEESSEPDSAPANHAGFNGIQGSSDDADRASIISVLEDVVGTTPAAGTVSGQAASVSEATVADDLGFTTQVTDGTSPAASTPVLQMAAAPAVQQVQAVETATQENTANTTSSTESSDSTTSPLGTDTTGWGTYDPYYYGHLAAPAPVLASAPMLGAAGSANSIVFTPDASGTGGTFEAGNWRRHYNSTATEVGTSNVEATRLLTTRLQVQGNTNATNLSAHGGDIVVGNGGQLFLQTWNAANISLANNILIGASTYMDGQNQMGTIRFGNDGGHTTTLEGNIYLIEDSSFYASTDTNASNAIYLNGTVTDLVDGKRLDNTLTIKQGKLYHFHDIDLSGLTLNNGVVMDYTGTATVGRLNGTGSITGTGLTINTAEGESAEYSGTLNLTGGLVKNGDGTQTLSAANTIAGGVTVDGGTLVAQAANSLGSADATVNTDGTLVLATENGMPAIKGSGTVLITDGDFQYHSATFLENFEGKVLIADGGLVQVGNYGTKFAKATLEIGTGGTIKGWGATFTKDILLTGGTLSDANDKETYGGAILVTGDATSYVNPTAGHTITFTKSVTVDEGSGLVVNGNIAMSGAAATFDINGSAQVNGTLNATAGTITVAGEASFASLDMSGSSTPEVVVKDGGILTLSQFSKSGTSKLTLEKGGKADLRGKVWVEGLEGGGAVLGTGTCSIDSADVTLKNVAVSAQGRVDIGNKLEGSTLTVDSYVTLNNAANTLTTTTVNGAWLNVREAMQLGDVTVNGGELRLTSSSPVTMASGTIGAGGTLKLSRAEQFIVDGGAFTFDSGAILDLSALNITQETPLTLATATGDGSFTEHNLGNIVFNFGAEIEHDNARLVVDGNALKLTFVQPQTDVLYWKGGPGVWDYQEKNWHPSTDTSSSVAFTDGKNLVFSTPGDSMVTITERQITTGDVVVEKGVNLDLSSNGTLLTALNVDVKGNLTVSNVAVTANSLNIERGSRVTADVEGTRQGALATDVSGAGDVVKKGTGTLTLTGDNAEFSGTVTIEQGTLIAGGNAGTALGGSPNVVLNGGKLEGNIAPGGDINITSAKEEATVSANIEVAAGKALTFNTDAGITLTSSGTISGAGDICKSGTGTLVLDTANTFTGDLNINAGTVLVSNVGALGSENTQNVTVGTGSNLIFEAGNNVYQTDHITLDRGSKLTFSGGVAKSDNPLLQIDTLSLTSNSSMDFSNIQIDRYGSYVLARVETMDVAEEGIWKPDQTNNLDLVQFVTMTGMNTAEGFPLSPDDLVSLHYDKTTKLLTLDVTAANTGYYWIPDRGEDSVWDTATANWRTSETGDPTNFVNKAGGRDDPANSAYFLDAGEDRVEKIQLGIDYIYLRDLVVAGGDYTFTFDYPQAFLNLDANRLSNFVVRSGATALFENTAVFGGENTVVHICSEAEATMNGVQQWDAYSVNNEGSYIVEFDPETGIAVGLLGHVDNTGTMSVSIKASNAESWFMVGEVMNREGATMVLALPALLEDVVYGNGAVHNMGDLTYGIPDEGVDGTMYSPLPIDGTGIFKTKGDGLTIQQDAIVEQSALELGAGLTEISGLVTVSDSTTVKSGATAVLSAGGTLGEVTLESNATLQLEGDGTTPEIYRGGTAVAGAGSVLKVDEDASLTLDSYNAGAPATGAIEVGGGTGNPALLTVEGETNAASLTVYDGEAHLHGGGSVTSLTQSGGTARFCSDAYLGGGSVSGGTLLVEDGKELTVGSVINVTGGNYAVAPTTGVINASALDLMKSMDNILYHEAVSGAATETQSGFLSGGEQYVKVFDLQNNATLTPNGATVIHKDAAAPMTLNDEGIGYLDTSETVYASYYVRDNYVAGVPGSDTRIPDYVTLSDVMEASKNGGATPLLETVVFDTTTYNEGKPVTGSLTVDVQEQHADLFDVKEGAVGVVSIGNDASGNRVMLCCCEEFGSVDGQMLIAGTGIYQLENRGTLGGGVSLLAETKEGIGPWRGTVRITGSGEGLVMAPLSVGSGATASEIEFSHWTGSFDHTAGQTVVSDAKILLTGNGVDASPAITLTPGNADMVWTNTVRGDNGRINHGQEGDFKLLMTGDTSEWDGVFSQSAAGTTVTLGFMDNVSASGVQSAEMQTSNGTMNVTYGGNVKTVDGKATVFGQGIMNLTYTGTDMTVNGTITQFRKQGALSLTVGDGTDAASATFSGVFDSTDNATMTVKAGSTATIDTDAALLRAVGEEVSSVVVNNAKTLSLASTDAAASYSQFYNLDNRGTIEMQGSGGDIKLIDTIGKTYDLGDLVLAGTPGTAAIEVSGVAGQTTVVNLDQLSSTGEGQVLKLMNDNGIGTVDYNLGGGTAFAGGTIQFGSNGASGDVNMVLNSGNVAAHAVLQSTGSGSGTANIEVNAESAQMLGIDSTEGSTAGGKIYGVGSQRVATVTGDGTYSYNGALGQNLDIAYTGSGKQTFEGGVDGFSGKVTVDNDSPAQGILEILNASSVSITDLTIGANDTLDVGSGTANVSDSVVAKGGSTSSATGTASKLNGNLTLASTATYDVSAAGGTGGLDLGGALTINTGAMMSANDMPAIFQMKIGDKYDLAFDVTSFNNHTEELNFTAGTAIDASELFAEGQFWKGEYYVCYTGAGASGGNGSNVGTVYLYKAMPEPTTGTLSLLALAALAARRRRK